MTINAIRECSDIFDNNLPYSFHDYFDVPCLAPSRQVFSFSSSQILFNFICFMWSPCVQRSPSVNHKGQKILCFQAIWHWLVTFWLLAYRKRLFTMINNLPTVYEVVTGTAKKEPKDKTPKNSNKSNKTGAKVWSFNCTVIILHDKLPTNSMILFWHWTFGEYTATPIRTQLKGPEAATSKGRRGEWRGGWGTTGRPWEHAVRRMRPKLRWLLDLLWPVWEMVPWQVREDHPSQSGTHQAVQVPLLHRQQEGQGLNLGNPNGQL